MTREKKTSPFPQAYKVITDMENDKEDTGRFIVTEPLIAACKAKNGVICDGCGKGDQTGLDWHMEQIIDESGNSLNVWTCKACQEIKSPSPKDETRYTYSATTLDTSVEEIKLPRKKSRVTRGSR